MTRKNVTPQELALSLTKQIAEHKYAFVFSVNYYPAISYTCNRFKIPYVCWSVDSPVPELFSNSLKNEWNRIFLFDKTQYEYFKPINPNCIFYLPLATNVDRWDEVLGMRQNEVECDKNSGMRQNEENRDNNSISATGTTEKKKIDYTYSSDISFVGSLYTEKSRYDTVCIPSGKLSDYTLGYVDGLLEAQEKIYGYNLMTETLPDRVINEIVSADPDFYKGVDTFENTDRYLVAHQYLGMKLASVERINKLCKLSTELNLDLATNSNTCNVFPQSCKIGALGPVDTLSEMPFVFHNSKININITMRAIESGLSLRIWDILGCGGFLLTNYQDEIFDYFTPGKELVVYESTEDMIAKAKYYLDHEEERAEIARCGYETVKNMHTYRHRLAEMIKILTEVDT